MMRRQIRYVAAGGIFTVLLFAVVVVVVLLLYTNFSRESRLAEELNSGLNDLQYLTTEFLATGTPRALKQWQSRHRRLGRFLDDVPVQDPEIKRLLVELQTRHKTLGSVFGKLTRIDSAISDPSRAAIAKRAAVNRLLNQILALSALNDRISSIYREREAAFARWTLITIGAVLFFGIVVVVVLYVRVLNVITRSVGRLSTEIVRLGKGDLEKPVEIAETGDIGAVFQALEQARTRIADAVAQKEQERADLDHFVYVASHDFKAPLRGIDNLATWIEEDAGETLNKDSREHLEMMRRRIKRLESLLDDLLEYSRAGRTRVEFEKVDVEEMLTALVENLQLPKGFRVNVEPGMPVIFSPKTPLAHVFINLISNAVKHHDKSEGTIDISGRISPQGYEFKVCDDGPGIPDKYRERIFEMFQTLKPRDVVEGSGMGLSIAKRLVQSNNGEISVVGEQARGTCFKFTWNPRREPDAQSSKE
ncbi:MAG: HAMP domain-containing protein [Rhodospirillales bacterium]|nr:HAMP domain-containing protein [Rhodospirillales bacterium]MBO6787774.1 HAMP domain-containing protein [Rhodospirillales bacterium]